VAPRIEKDVRERVPHFARRAQDVEVEAVREHRSAAREDTVHSSREARSDGLHPRCEVAVARGFHDQMHVIVLDRVVSYPEASAIASLAEGALQLAHEPDGAQ
jgi:hypothetical protein